ncbi:hypothetical protein EDM54_06800 [Brevibacillus borstelensis]|uniref:Uncharacterized protein n=1 Tax=Brevibacillus borstelensis AK1 TaxID=1300222 RepID=M8D804_9BACL|nr:hypothetical protein I532_12119 [Brevibacillus borstelensis AK1]KKX54833.1 hypothetical protein X546_13565 [Brevibacillus borstelensis cifa_chp40]RNB64409.1 hypothetical protein EDM54_06800 [Brevibacillus borstelensis]
MKISSNLSKKLVSHLQVPRLCEGLILSWFGLDYEKKRKRRSVKTSSACAFCVWVGILGRGLGVRENKVRIPYAESTKERSRFYTECPRSEKTEAGSGILQLLAFR